MFRLRAAFTSAPANERSQQLLTAAGMPYSGRTLQESGIICTTLRIRPVAYRDRQVDIEVRTRDVWTLNRCLSFGRSGGENMSVWTS